MTEENTQMEPACEGHPQIIGVSEGVHVVQRRPEVLEQPVLEGSGETDGKHWEFEHKLDLWDGETLSLETMAPPVTDRKDLRKYTSALAAPIETLDWARPELMNGYFCGWENLDFQELPNGDLLVIYDVQNWICEPGAEPVKAVRCVRMRREKQSD